MTVYSKHTQVVLNNEDESLKNEKKTSGKKFVS